MSELDLERELDNLFAAPVGEFTRRRNELAGMLRGAGRARDAERVAKLDKPSVVAWAANHVVITGREQYEAFARATEALRRAQAAGEPLGEVMKAQREAQQKLLERARAALSEVGHAASPAVMQKIGGTLQALAAGVLGAKPGRMARELEPPGFEALSGLVRAGAAVKTAPAEKAEQLEAKKALDEARGALRVAEARQQRLARELEEAEKLRLQAAERVESATAALEKARAQASDAEQRAGEASAELARAAAELGAARKRLEDLGGG